MLLQGAFQQDPQSSRGCQENDAPASPVLDQHPKRKRSLAEIRRSIKDACATVMSQTALRAHLDKAIRAEADSLHRYKSSQMKKRPQPGPEKEKFRPGTSDKKARKTYGPPVKPKWGTADDMSRAFHKRLLMKRLDKYRQSEVITPPTLNSLKAELEYRRSLRPIKVRVEPVQQRTETPPVEPIVQHITKPSGEVLASKPDHGSAKLIPPPTDLRKSFDESLKATREKLEESARRRDQANQVVLWLL